jgi:DNA polymerase III subunit delta'
MAGVTRYPSQALPGIEAHPHAAAVLGPGLPPAGSPSHAYLFHGPAGSGKRAAARAFAATLLAGGPPPPDVAERVARLRHPDLTWVKPSGAAEMLVSDVDGPVVAAAARTPFEASRRVFVIESADAMNDQAANRMLKTLEEPPAFVCVLLLTDRREDMLATVLSRCQHVRFDPPRPEQIAQRLECATRARANACARLSLGDTLLAQRLAGEQGEALRAGAEAFARWALGRSVRRRPWAGLLELARAAGASAGGEAADRIERELELVPRRERRRLEREGQEAIRRGERRARTRTLDLALRLAELWLRDVLCVLEGAPELVHAVDRDGALGEDARQSDGEGVRAGIELISDARTTLALNVSEELALEGLAYRLSGVLDG